MKDNAIITAAITGAVHIPSISEYLPITPQQIIDQAVGAAEAGAAVVHIHGRRKEDGMPTGDPEVMIEIVEGIRKRSADQSDYRRRGRYDKGAAHSILAADKT